MQGMGAVFLLKRKVLLVNNELFLFKFVGLSTNVVVFPGADLLLLDSACLIFVLFFRSFRLGFVLW